jgi:hypothetical protein
MQEIERQVRDYYSTALGKFGPTALGVDWPSTASQYLRFVQLLRVCEFGNRFSLNDFGCGYGALLAYLAWRHPSASIDYRGIDISHSMIEAARSLWADNRLASFSVGRTCERLADYSLASGVFNVRLGTPEGDWEAYIRAILNDLRRMSDRGFATNFMLPWDGGRHEDALYRTSPDQWIAYCESDLCCETELISDYGLREFTLLCRI